MKIGIAGKDHDGGFSSGYEFPSKEAILVDANLPIPVVHGLEMIQHYIPSSLTKVPIAIVSAQGHGDDYGLVFRISESDSIQLLADECCASFTNRNLVARISMGMPIVNGEDSEFKTSYRDSSQISRLHLNVFGARNFIPVDELKCRDEDKKTSFFYITELIHFSLRWIDGTFDNAWNEPYQWLKEKDSRRLNKFEFNQMRTTYLESRISYDHVNGNYYHDLSGYIPSDVSRRLERGDKILTLRDVETVLGPKKEQQLLPNLTFEEFSKLFPTGTVNEDVKSALGYGFERRNDFPHIGYVSALDVLSRFGDVSTVDAFKIPQMTMEQGVEYIFGKILPAMKNFTQV